MLWTLARIIQGFVDVLLKDKLLFPFILRHFMFLVSQEWGDEDTKKPESTVTLWSSLGVALLHLLVQVLQF